MLWVYATTNISLFQRGDSLYTSESDVKRRQNLAYIDGPRAEMYSFLDSLTEADKNLIVSNLKGKRLEQQSTLILTITN